MISVIATIWMASDNFWKWEHQNWVIRYLQGCENACFIFKSTGFMGTLPSNQTIASSAILSDFYVDDFLSGADDVDAADKLKTELCDLLSQAGMTLRKWRSNSLELRQRIPDHLLEKDSTSLTFTQPNQAPKALGIHWDVEHDTLHVSIPPTIPSDTTITKRVIASGTAGVFEVLGLFAPAIIPARIIFQETWKRSLSWDKPVPDDIKDRWDTWIHDLPSVNSLAIPRRLSPSQRKTVFQSLHGFCDASSVAYGVAIYLRSVSEDGSISTTLVIAKARVLPVKPVTIPRAELLGAHLLAKMLSHTSSLLEIPPSQVFAWTDSEIVLYWLPKSPSQLVRLWPTGFMPYKISFLIVTGDMSSLPTIRLTWLAEESEHQTWLPHPYGGQALLGSLSLLTSGQSTNSPNLWQKSTASPSNQISSQIPHRDNS